MEKITRIQEIEDFKIEARKPNFDGYIIKTNERNLYFLIDNRQCCCEQWGYMTSEDNLDDFIGAEIIDIMIVDSEKCQKESIKKRLERGMIREDSCIFVEIKTNKGDFQLVIYNEHNGFYDHEVFILNKRTHL